MSNPNTLSPFQPDVWVKPLIPKINQTNIMLPLCNTRFDGNLRDNPTIKVRTAGNISMTSYSKGDVISYQGLAPALESFTVSDASYWAFEVDDVDAVQSDINALSVYTERSAVTLNNTIEAKIMSAYTLAGVALGAAPAGTGAILTPVITAGAISSITITAGGTGYTTAPVIQFVGGNGNGVTATCTVSGGAINAVTVVTGGNNYTVAPTVLLTTSTAIALTSTAGGPTDVYNQFITARAVLSKQNIPATAGARWAVVDPDTVGLLLLDTEHFVRAGELGDKVVQSGYLGGEEIARTAAQAPGFVGMVAGFSVYETPHTPHSGANKFLMFGDNQAITYASQIVSMEALRLQTTFANAVRGLLLHDKFVPAECSKRLLTIQAVA